MQRSLDFQGELLVDLFAGGGGASTGIERGAGRPVDIAVNHDPEAIAMHELNHRHTQHFCESVFRVNPRAVTRDQPVGLLWASPDCTSHSIAKGSAPVKKKLRGLAWVVLRWARRTRPRIIMLENVKEFERWGPLREDGTPCPDREGQEFKRFVNHIERQGYRVEFRCLRASQFATCTIRTRLFMIARRDGLPIVWPECQTGSEDVLGPGACNSALSKLDLAEPVRSIFERSKPLVDRTLSRIARGLQDLVVSHDQPCWLADSNGSLLAAAGRHEPSDHGSAVDALLDRFDTAGDGSRHISGIGQQTPIAVAGFLTLYYSSGNGLRGRDLRLPLPTVTARDRMQLVLVFVETASGRIIDIATRMLTPREMYLCQGFGADYVIDRGADGRKLTKVAQKRLVGNSVPPAMAEALARANLAHERALCDSIKLPA